ncbi:hypothetical protein M0R19_04860 [Candidatus Pacearchaeota archaeon]|jgi:hypothetical protein|nr:hypothetical protein [Candidatus Pacearchaeota archaeon]
MAATKITAETRGKANAMCPIANEVGLGNFTQATTFNGLVAWGAGVLGTTGSLDVTTGITSLIHIEASLIKSTSPGDGPYTFSYGTHTAGVVRIYAWCNTSGSDPTLIAGTASIDISWLAIGTVGS